MRRPTAFLVALLLAPPLAAQRAPAIAYHLRVAAGDTTGVDVELRVRDAGDAFTVAWVRHPEYDDRYWRFVDSLRVVGGGARIARLPCERPAACEDARWQVTGARGETVLRWRQRLPVEPRPRGAWRPFLSPSGALLGGPHAFPIVLGRERVPAQVTLSLPAGWATATALQPGPSAGVFRAANAEELVESPILAGALRIWRFDVRGVPHRVAYWAKPNAPAFDTTAFVGALARLAAQADSLFGGMPYREFTFLFQDEAYGGLEHPSSTVLGAPSAQLAQDQRSAIENAAHEFVHTWNLMAIRPRAYGPVTWRAPTAVESYWFGEGLTMYYADLLLRRAGLPTSDSTRVAHVEDMVRQYLQNPAYAAFSPESLSRVAYNAGPDALGDHSASIHLAGEVLGTALDLMIRERTAGRRSVDDVMRLLFRRSRSDPDGIVTADVERAVADVCACDARPFFDRHVRGATPVDIGRWLSTIGLRLEVAWAPERRADGSPAPDWRVWAWNPDPAGPLRLRLQTPSAVWGRAGLHTGDVVLAVNDSAVTSWPEFRRAVSRLQVGDPVRVRLAERGGERTVRFTMTGFDRPDVRIVEAAEASPELRARRERWLRGW